ncbi:hypothetical protein CNR22_17755 [Sphingobacteriaceae bacterium]|nr:hypothetical protein CNR22_17755 [Sphingobacteriaceae bacterium]
MQKKTCIFRFGIKLSLFLIPFIVLILSFVVIDPFMVVKKYKRYTSVLAGLNADVVSTETYLKNREKRRYNSFIFGNSRAMAYKTAEWKKHLDATDRPYLYLAFNESLYGLLSKVKFVDQQKDTLKNALFVIDETLLTQTTDRTDFHLYIKDPRVTGSSKQQFYYTFFKAYLSDFFFVKCIDYSLFGKKRAYMKGALDGEGLYFDPETNDLYPMSQMTARLADSAAYYSKFRSNGPTLECTEKPDKKVILKNQEDMLLEMKHILDKQKTDYKIIISPKFNCYTMHPEDLEVLERIFGKNRVYNFSGSNKYTKDLHNFYDPFHYSMEVGKDIMKKIYEK